MLTANLPSMLLRRAAEVRNRRIGRNVPLAERLASIAVGTTALIAGARRRSVGGSALGIGGAALAMRGLTGQCPYYRHRALVGGIEARRTMLVQRSRREIYRALHRMDRWPAWLSQVDAIHHGGDDLTRWEVGRGADVVRFTAHTTADIIDRRIAWESTPGSEVIGSGSIELRDAPSGGTIVDVQLRYRPRPGALIPHAVQRLFEGFTGRRLASDLLTLRTLLLTGALAPHKVEPVRPPADTARPPIPGPWPLRAMDRGLGPVKA